MTERERLEIDLDSIKLVYQTQHKEFKEKLSKEKYPHQKRYTRLECFATDLDNFYWTTKECIIRAERLGVTYNKDELLERLKDYTDRFLKVYKQEKDKVDKKVLKKTQGLDYIKTIIY